MHLKSWKNALNALLNISDHVYLGEEVIQQAWHALEIK
jgi:hypothetical protein